MVKYPPVEDQEYGASGVAPVKLKRITSTRWVLELPVTLIPPEVVLWVTMAVPLDAETGDERV